MFFRLLAGAPKEKSALLQNVNETGAVYSCPISTSRSDCTRMELLTSSKSTKRAVPGVTLRVADVNLGVAHKGRGEGGGKGLSAHKKKKSRPRMSRRAPLFIIPV